MDNGRKIRLGIGFATGRKSFRKVLNAYLYGWRENDPQVRNNVELNLFVAYDLDYSNTQSTDYTNLSQHVVDMVDEIHFIGKKNIQKEILALAADGVLPEEDAQLIFSAGYAGKRNAILYTAIKNGMDYLLFLDDDEYPLAVTNRSGTALWSGQHVIAAHLQAIEHADVTNGHHCGYISPIPQVSFSEDLPEKVFKNFIEALSNDVLNWESMREIMRHSGVTYADTDVLAQKRTENIPLTNGCKFITGGNLCLNLKRPERTFPFYNPPGARGEDTFLSTLLEERDVLRIPCYTFHDGFSAYQHLLDGVLPTQLESVLAGAGDAKEKIGLRFFNACMGWVRYKPLLLSLTHPESCAQTLQRTHQILSETLAVVGNAFGNRDFMKLLTEFERYARNIEKHRRQFLQVRRIWEKLTKSLG